MGERRKGKGERPEMSGLKDSVRDLHPAYFAMVMATGIVSISAYLLGMGGIATVLFRLNIVLYVILWFLTLARLIGYPRNFFLDLIDHNRGVGFFTLVAGTCVLGSQFVIFIEDIPTAKFLWFLGILLWALLTYTVFTGLAVKETKPTLAEGIHGGWLVAVVATQAVSILGVLLLPHFRGYQQEIIFFSLSLWLWGGMLYIWMISLIFYRYVFFKFSPSDLTPPYWINMGAMAISTLAGTVLIKRASQSALLEGMLPFLKSFTLFFWATGTWWIPMLVILGAWRYIYKRFKLAYNPLYWGAVFPLGMYTACTFHLAEVLGLPFLFEIPKYFIYAALFAWALTFLGLLRSVGVGLFKVFFQPGS